jgi:hypothetical protein
VGGCVDRLGQVVGVQNERKRLPLKAEEIGHLVFLSREAP